MKLDQKYPTIDSLEPKARSRVPGFAYEYFISGIGPESSLKRNRDALEAVELMPRYICDFDKPDLSASLFGRQYDQPFGMAPVGLSGLIWPGTAEILARTAKDHNVPFVLSSFANSSLETIHDVAGENAWFQLYVPSDDDVLVDILKRAETVGYSVLVLTIDSPASPRRERELRNSLELPPKLNAKKLAQIISRPTWAANMLISGTPTLPNFDRYVGSNANLGEAAEFFGNLIKGHVSLAQLQKIRDLWPGKLVVKGVIHPEDAAQCMAVGVDGLLVSNHGGRQLDAAPSSVEVVRNIRAVVGPDMVILADSGVRTGLDVARMIASGANSVLLGRAFVSAVAAIGVKGGDHAMHILKEEFYTTMGQIGCEKPENLPDFLVNK